MYARLARRIKSFKLSIFFFCILPPPPFFFCVWTWCVCARAGPNYGRLGGSGVTKERFKSVVMNVTRDMCQLQMITVLHDLIVCCPSSDKSGHYTHMQWRITHFHFYFVGNVAEVGTLTAWRLLQIIDKQFSVIGFISFFGGGRSKRLIWPVRFHWIRR